jgi:hypothetical protein
MSNSAWANRTIPRPTKGVRLVKENYNLRDIAKLCHRAFLEDAWQVRAFSKAFPPTRAGLRALFNFVDENFEYVEDRGYTPRGKEVPVQAVQSPSAMWHTTRQGDCKSFTVFIAATVHNMGLPVILRLVGYGSKYEKHIYPVALLNGQEIPLDVVYKKQQNGPFGSEKLPMDKIQDIVEKAGLYKVGKMAPQVTEADLQAALNNINAVADSIPNYVDAYGGDITSMSAGEFDAWQLGRALDANGQSMRALPADAQQKVARHIANNRQAAFRPVKVAVPVPAGTEVSGVKDVLDKIADAIKKALKKFVNVFHKEDTKKIAPFFLYLFLTPAQLAKARPQVRKRHAKQSAILDNMVRKGLGSRSQILASMATNFKKQYGVTPQVVLATAINRRKKMGAVGAEAAAGGGAGGTAEAQLALKAIDTLDKNKEKIVEAVRKVWNILKAIFKKKDKADEAAEADSNAANASDLSLLENTDGGAADTGADTATDTATDTNEASGAGSNMLLPLGIGLAALYFISK